MLRPPSPDTRHGPASDGPPDTRHSLIVRLQNHDDRQAWNEFFEIYEPLIYRLARGRGFQDADASEITQDVLIAVSRAIGQFQPSADGGTFRGWLARIARNHALNRLRSQANRPLDGSVAMHRIENVRAPSDEAVQREFDTEYRKQIFLWAADQLRDRFQPTTWRAFWRTCVEGADVAQVATELNVSAGTVYVARCRIIARLREIVQMRTQEDSHP